MAKSAAATAPSCASRAVTSDALRYLLHDLFVANIFWELETEVAAAKQTAAGTWQVTLRVKARKVTVDPAGGETEVPMDEDPDRRLRPHRESGCGLRRDALSAEPPHPHRPADDLGDGAAQAVRRRRRPLSPADRPGAVRQRRGGGDRALRAGAELHVDERSLESGNEHLRV